MKPEIALSYLQKPHPSPYPEPLESSPQSHALFIKIHSNITFLSMTWFSEWTLPITFCDWRFVCTSDLSHSC